MSQKINPIKNKLGILQTWSDQFTKYGYIFKNYKKFVQAKNYSFVYLKRYLYKNKLLIENIEFKQLTYQFMIKISVFKLKQNSPIPKSKYVVLNNLSNWLNFPIKLVLYQKTNLSNSSCLISNYVFHLLLQKRSSVKQILQVLYSILKKQSYQTKLIFTVKGLQLIKLKGFKIEITGCFEASRSQMAKTLKCNFGSSPLTKLNGYIDYSSTRFFTKFGSCGLKLWLFYELT